jgi:hypothetical protein
MKPVAKKIIIALLILGVAVISLSPSLGRAGHEVTEEDLTSQLQGSCGFTNFFTLLCISKGVARLIFIVFSVFAWLLAAFGNLFSYAMSVTIDNANYTGIPALIQGWTFVRDLVNIFLVFILLSIAIATILQIESYGARSLLFRLILIALLVNFSFLAAQGIIFITNSLALQLYSTLPDQSPFLKKHLNKPGFDRDIAGSLQKGLASQTIFNVAPGTNPKGLTSAEEVRINIAIIIILVGGIIIFLLAGFIFLVGSFFLVTRMALLWLLLILAPFGFVFLILPVTRGYALQWWKTLQSQALFAPAFLFFIIITINIINAPVVQSLRAKTSAFTTTASAAIKSQPATNDFLILLLIQNLVIIILLFASLIIAKSLGVYGANASIVMANSAGKAFRGYVGGATKRGAIRVAGVAARPLHAVATAPGRIPFIGGAFRAALKPVTATTGAAIRASEKQTQERENKYKGLSQRALVGEYRGTVNPIERRNILRVASETGKLRDFSEREMRRAYQQNINNPRARQNILNNRPDFAADGLEGDEAQNAVNMAISRMTEKSIEEMMQRPALQNEFVRRGLISSVGEREGAAVLRKFGDEAAEAINEGATAFGTMADTYDEMMENNRSLMRGMFRNPALSIQLRFLRDNMEIVATGRGVNLRDELDV